MDTNSISHRHLATFENAYAVAIRLKESTSIDQYVVSTGDVAQPFRVVPRAPGDISSVVSLVA